MEDAPPTGLASIEVIRNLRGIEGCDNIERATVLGYETVVKKGEFTEGQLIVWHQPDTVLPDKPMYSFLASQGFRLKVRRIRGVISQGLAASIEDVFGHLMKTVPRPLFSEGDDVTSMTGIVKYQKPEVDAEGRPNRVKVRNWPVFLKKTDELNLRARPHALQEFTGKEIIITSKVDGSSVTFYYRRGQGEDPGKFGVCSRNMDLERDPEDPYWVMALKHNLPETLEALCVKKGCDLALQGEMYGPKVQGNRLGVPERRLALFNLFDISEQIYLSFDHLVDVASELNVPTVTTVWRGTCAFALQDLVEMANGLDYPNKKPAEGIVLRPSVEVYSESLKGRLSGKVISERFCLKYGE